MANGAEPLVITDPTVAPRYREGWFSRACRSRLYDPRDEVFVRLTLKSVAAITLAMGTLLFFFHWALVPLYLAVWGWLTPPVILMLHCTMHRPFLKGPAWMNRWHAYGMSFFFGIPTGYATHHIGMHHVEDNMPEDLSSTLRYKRDSFLHFLLYFGRFLFILFELPAYLSRKKRTKLVRRAVLNELVQDAILVGFLAYDWKFGLVLFVIPYFLVRFMMMVGNWGQHAFINTSRKNDGYSNAISCINTGYNRRAFNDGYHIGHHLKANRHWTEMPEDLLKNRESYARNGAIVFRGLDFFMVSLLLWTNQWEALAKRFVRLDGRERSDEEVIAMLKSRVQPVRVEEWTPIQAERA